MRSVIHVVLVSLCFHGSKDCYMPTFNCFTILNMQVFALKKNNKFMDCFRLSKTTVSVGSIDQTELYMYVGLQKQSRGTIT